MTDSLITFRNCGELDQRTEASLINSFRRVQLPPPRPISSRLVAAEVTRLQYSASNETWPETLKPRYLGCYFSTILREVIRLPDCKSGVTKQNRKRRIGTLPTLPTNLSRTRSSRAEQPVVCGKAEGASPFGSANLTGDMFQGTASPFPQNQVPGAFQSPGQTACGVAATCSAWDGVIAGAIPAVDTILMMMRGPSFAIRVLLPSPWTFSQGCAGATCATG